MLAYSLSRSLSTFHKPSAHELLQRDLCTRHVTDEKVSCAIIQVAYQRKNENLNQHIYSATIDGNHATYENVLSIPIYDLSHWHVLTCEAHPGSSAKCLGTNSVYCSAEAGDSMARTGHRGDSEEFALQVWCEYLQETYKRFSLLRGLQMELISMHGGMYSMLNSFLVAVEGNGPGKPRGPGILD